MTGALLLATLTFNASPSVAENLAAENPNQQANNQQTAKRTGASLPADAATSPADPSTPAAAGESATADKTDAAEPADKPSPAADAEGAAQAAPQKFTATAYALRGRTASGATVRRGLIAADRRVLPLGSRVRIEAGPYSGEYLVADRGGAVRGRTIDIWVPSTREAMRFGRRPVKLTVLTRTRPRKAQPNKAGRNN
jgi:3D (Asp-Asp-Asp) domain-containing protein